MDTVLMTNDVVRCNFNHHVDMMQAIQWRVNLKAITNIMIDGRVLAWALLNLLYLWQNTHFHFNYLQSCFSFLHALSFETRCSTRVSC